MIRRSSFVLAALGFRSSSMHSSKASPSTDISSTATSEAPRCTSPLRSTAPRRSRTCSCAFVGSSRSIIPVTGAKLATRSPPFHTKVIPSGPNGISSFTNSPPALALSPASLLDGSSRPAIAVLQGTVRPTLCTTVQTVSRTPTGHHSVPHRHLPLYYSLSATDRPYRCR